MLKIQDECRERIKSYFPEEDIPEARAGRKPVPARKILDAVLWILKTGVQWSMLLQFCPDYKDEKQAPLIEPMGIPLKEFPRICANVCRFSTA